MVLLITMRADTTTLPVTTNAIATNAAFRIVRLILLMIQVRMRCARPGTGLNPRALRDGVTAHIDHSPAMPVRVQTRARISR